MAKIESRDDKFARTIFGMADERSAKANDEIAGALKEFDKNGHMTGKGAEHIVRAVMHDDVRSLLLKFLIKKEDQTSENIKKMFGS